MLHQATPSYTSYKRWNIVSVKKQVFIFDLRRVIKDSYLFFVLFKINSKGEEKNKERRIFNDVKKQYLELITKRTNLIFNSN